MEFCDICENMLFLTSRETDGVHSLMRTCKKCGNERVIDGSSVVSSMTFDKKEQHKSVINKYTKLDPTLPHIYTVPCPNDSCPNHTADSPDIIYVRYDNTDLKYVYICPLCDTVWETVNN